MEEIKRYADLLLMLNANGGVGLPVSPSSSSDEEDAEILEWAFLVSKADAGILQKARLRICSAGLLAVHRHIASNPESSW